MADLVLDEQRVPAVLEQVGDIGAAQRVEVQPGGQAEGVAGLGEPPVQRADPDPLARARTATTPPSPPAAGNSGRASSIHCSSTPGSHGQTVSTLRRFGGDPRLALPNRTRHRP